MDDVLSRISSDHVLGEAVISHLGLSLVSLETTHVTVANTSSDLLQSAVSSQLASGSSQSVVYTSNSVITESNNILVSQSASSERPLVVWVHKSGASTNNPLATRVHQSK